MYRINGALHVQKYEYDINYLHSYCTLFVYSMRYESSRFIEKIMLNWHKVYIKFV